MSASAILEGQQDTASNEPENIASNSGCFVGVHIAFWTRSHTATLKSKAVQAGAILDDRITSNTNLVIAARDTSAVDASAGLANLPASVPRLSKKWEGQKLKIPTNIDLVVPQYISDCLVQGRLLPTSAYLIALQQVASNDIRTYSNEEYKISTDNADNADNAAEVNQLPKPESAVQQQSSPSYPTQAQPKAAEASNPTVAGCTTGSTDVLPDEGEGRQASSLIQPATGMQEAAGPSAEKKIGIHPDVSPEGRAFTGGQTSIPWGTGQALHTQQRAALYVLRHARAHIEMHAKFCLSDGSH